jgi:amino acid permease
MVACLVIIGDTLPPSLDDFFGAEHLKTRDEIVVIVAVLIVLPLSLVRHISSLACASGMAFVAVVVLVLGVLIVAPTESSSQGLEFDVNEDLTIVNKHVFRGIGILSFHYVCQHSCLLIFKSLESPSMENVQAVSLISLGFVLVLSLLIGLGGYVFFGQTASGNILNNFHAKSKL